MKNDNAIELEQQKALEDVPTSCKNPFRKAYARRSATQAIKAMCLDCLQFDKKAIRECTAPRCPLWRYRPYQVKRTAKGAGHEHKRGQ